MKIFSNFLRQISNLITGKLVNGQRLLEFSVETEDRSLHQELRVRVATVWIRVDLRPGFVRRFRRLRQDKTLTLWIFRLVEPFDTYGGGYLDAKVIVSLLDLFYIMQIFCNA